MLTIEYRVNGQLIGFTNIKNTLTVVGGSITLKDPPDCIEHVYDFSHKPTEMTGTMSGSVRHNREDGFEVLVHKVLGKITKQI